MGNEIIDQCSCFRKNNNFRDQEEKSEKKFKEIEGSRNNYGSEYLKPSMQSLPYETNDINVNRSLKSGTIDSLPKNLEPKPNEKLLKNNIEKIQGLYRGYSLRKKFNDFCLFPSKEEEKILKQKYQKCIENYKKLDKFPDNFNRNNYQNFYDIGEYNKILEENNITPENSQNLYNTNGCIAKYLNKECFYKGGLDKEFNFSGPGELYLNNNEIFLGNFKFGELNGWGRYIDNKGNCYEGLFLNGNLRGKGIEYYLDDSGNNVKYTGDFIDTKKNGKGKEESDECTYEGDFKNDMKNGKGKLNYKTCKDSYDGDFTDGVITGYGTYIWENQHTYTGDFIDGKMHGNGVYYWPDGSMYKGQYINNIKEGQGEFTWKDGRYYKGSFKAGKPHGKGLLTVKGVTVDATFDQGKFQGSLKEAIKNKKIRLQNDSNNNGYD